MKARAAEVSMSILPAAINGNPMQKVGEVLGILMERAGMTNLELCHTEFRPPQEADFNATVSAMSAFVVEQKIGTEYALYAAFQGSPEKGFQKIYGIVTDREGNPVWLFTKTGEDKEFQEANLQDPMACCIFVAQHLRTDLGLEDPLRDDAPEGKLAQKMRQDSGIPADAEMKAMEDRLAGLKTRKAPVSLTVYPVQVIDAFDTARQEDLVARINKEGFFKAESSSEEIKIEPKQTSGMPEVLWHLAKAFQAHMKEHTPKTEYGLFAHCIYFPPDKPEFRGMYGILCDREGNWVFVTLANNHHEDFQKLDPSSPNACGELLSQRLMEALK